MRFDICSCLTDLTNKYITFPHIRNLYPVDNASLAGFFIGEQTHRGIGGGYSDLFELDLKNHRNMLWEDPHILWAVALGGNESIIEEAITARPIPLSDIDLMDLFTGLIEFGDEKLFIKYFKRYGYVDVLSISTAFYCGKFKLLPLMYRLYSDRRSTILKEAVNWGAFHKNLDVIKFAFSKPGITDILNTLINNPGQYNIGRKDPYNIYAGDINGDYTENGNPIYCNQLLLCDSIPIVSYVYNKIPYVHRNPKLKLLHASLYFPYTTRLFKFYLIKLFEEGELEDFDFENTIRVLSKNKTRWESIICKELETRIEMLESEYKLFKTGKYRHRISELKEELGI